MTNYMPFNYCVKKLWLQALMLLVNLIHKFETGLIIVELCACPSSTRVNRHQDPAVSARERGEDAATYPSKVSDSCIKKFTGSSKSRTMIRPVFNAIPHVRESSGLAIIPCLLTWHFTTWTTPASALGARAAVYNARPRVAGAIAFSSMEFGKTRFKMSFPHGTSPWNLS
jgi:hypothetical protein